MSHAPRSTKAGPPTRSLLAVALLAIGLSALSLAAPSGVGVARAAEIRSGHADWGIRESFRDYVKGPIAQGDVTVSEGAEENDDGTFRFPVVGGELDPDAEAVEVATRGKVRFRGHREASGEYELWMTVANLNVVIERGAGTLYADVVSRDRGSGELRRYPGVDLADLEPGEPSDLGSEGGAWADVPATLSEEGAPAFGGFYGTGDELDSVDLVPRGDDGPGEPAPSPEGSDDDGSGAPTPVVARRPLLKRLGGRVRPVARDGVAALALVGCRPPTPCVLRTRRFAVVKVGRRALRARVLAPRAVKAGGWAGVRLWLPPGARRALSARHGRVTVPVAVRSGGQRVVRTVGAVLRSVPVRGGRGRASR